MSNLDFIVCMKPVPDPRKWGRLKLDPETMLLRRADIPPVINPLDRNAIEQALELKARFGGKVRVITMAPPDADEQLTEALAMGCDSACLLSDAAFAGADTLATARCLAAAIRKTGKFDVVLCGGYSLDGSTAQVGPQLAELLGIPDLLHATNVELKGNCLRAHCKLEDGYAICEAELPVLVSLAQEANKPRLPSMIGVMNAAQVPIVTWGIRDLDLDPGTVGLRGSPTQMLNVYTAPGGRKGAMFQGGADEVVTRLLERLHADKVLS
jgi:electron transfer flavoprotein beta subunit